MTGKLVLKLWTFMTVLLRPRQNLELFMGRTKLWELKKITTSKKYRLQLRIPLSNVLGQNWQKSLVSCLFSISAAIQHGSSLVARQYAKYGCPAGLRGEVWKLILGLEVDDLVCRYFFTRCLYLRQGGDEKSRLQQTAYVNLYNVTEALRSSWPLFAGYV